jgi:hypothetical protein
MILFLLVLKEQQIALNKIDCVESADMWPDRLPERSRFGARTETELYNLSSWQTCLHWLCRRREKNPNWNVPNIEGMRHLFRLSILLECLNQHVVISSQLCSRKKTSMSFLQIRH